MGLFKKEPEEKISTKKIVITTMVGADTTVEGTIVTKNSIRIDGEVIGGVTCQGIVIVSKGAKIRGNIFAENVIVAGVIEGDTTATEKVNVEPTGEVYGDITTKKLLVDEESIFLGNCHMNRGKADKKKNVVDNLSFKEQPSKAEVKVEPKAETKPAAKPVAKPEAKPAAKVEVKPVTKAEAKPEAKPVAKPETKPVSKTDAKLEVKSEVKAEARPAAVKTEK